MKRVYIKPEMEVSEFRYEGSLLMGSDIDHGDAKKQDFSNYDDDGDDGTLYDHKWGKLKW